MKKTKAPEVDSTSEQRTLAGLSTQVMELLEKNRRILVSDQLSRIALARSNEEIKVLLERLQAQGRRLRRANMRNRDLFKKLQQMVKDHRREKKGFRLAIEAAVACRNARDSSDKKLLRRPAKVRVPTGVEKLGKNVKAIGQFMSSVAVSSNPLIPPGL